MAVVDALCCARVACPCSRLWPRSQQQLRYMFDSPEQQRARRGAENILTNGGINT